MLISAYFCDFRGRPNSPLTKNLPANVNKHGSALRRGRGGDRKAPSSPPQRRNPRETRTIKPEKISQSANRETASFPKQALQSPPLLADDLRNPFAALRAQRRVLRFHHHAHQRFRAALAHKHTPRVAQLFLRRANRVLHLRIRLRRLLVLYPHVNQLLRINRQVGSQLMQRFLRRAHDLHHLQARQDAVAG